MSKRLGAGAAALLALVPFACAKPAPTPATPPEPSAAAPPPVPPPASAVPADDAAAPVASASAAPPAPSASAPAEATPEPPPESGFVVRNSDGTCSWNYQEYCCPPKAMCKPTPEPKDVPCPPLAQVREGKPKGDVGDYMEERTNHHCYTGPNPKALHRTLCCAERYPGKR